MVRLTGKLPERVNELFVDMRSCVCVCVCVWQRQRLSASLALQHVDAGRRLYHSSLCQCCPHAAVYHQCVDADRETSFGNKRRPADTTTDSRSLPLQHDIPLDTGNDDGLRDTASVDALKGNKVKSNLAKGCVVVAISCFGWGFNPQICLSPKGQGRPSNMHNVSLDPTSVYAE